MSVAHDINWQLACLFFNESMAVWKMTDINAEGVSKDVVARREGVDVL